ncbi:MAG: hypothetical protein JWO82_186 [Akkermansiaceae bacterium]|nr:hypothetical protein [Akkermansiaceae bacterium]
MMNQKIFTSGMTSSNNTSDSPGNESPAAGKGLSRRSFLHYGGSAAATLAGVAALPLAATGYASPQTALAGDGSWRVYKVSPTAALPTADAYSPGWTDATGQLRARLSIDFLVTPGDTDKHLTLDGQVKATCGASYEKLNTNSGQWLYNSIIMVTKVGKVYATFNVPDETIQNGHMGEPTLSGSGSGKGFTLDFSTSATAGDFTSTKDLDLTVRLKKPASGTQPTIDVPLTQKITIGLAQEQ